MPTTPFSFSLRHFFQGGMSREEAASACLAMLLEGSEAFRQHFFSLVLPAEAQQLAAGKWEVHVEVDAVDVWLAADDLVILIENKLCSGAKQAGQLLRYYLHQRARFPNKRIVAIYLAPRQVGLDEVERTRLMLGASSDLAIHLSWKQLAQLPPSFSDPHPEWIKSILDQISAAIDAAYVSKYRREGERKILRDLVDQAAVRIKATSTIGLKRWSGKGIEELFSTRTAISVSTGILFPFVEQPPYTVLGVVSESGHMNVNLRTYLSLAKKVRKSSPLAAWWKSLATDNAIEVPGLGRHLCQNHSYLEYTQELNGDEAAVENALVQTWQQLSQFIDGELQRAGLGPNTL